MLPTARFTLPSRGDDMELSSYTRILQPDAASRSEIFTLPLRVISEPDRVKPLFASRAGIPGAPGFSVVR